MKLEIKTAINELTTKVKRSSSGGLITNLSIDLRLQPADIARILNMQKQDAPLYIIIGSEQLLFDLDISVAEIQLS